MKKCTDYRVEPGKGKIDYTNLDFTIYYVIIGQIMHIL